MKEKNVKPLETMAGAEAPGTISISRVFSLFLVACMGLFGLCICVFVAIAANHAFSQIQEAEHKKRALSFGEGVMTYVENRRYILEDQAAFPAVVQAVMQPGESKANITDFMDALSVLGKKPQMFLLDFEGHMTHTTKEKPIIHFAQREWVSRLIAGSINHFNGIIHSGDTPYWCIAVPVLYNGRPEGILAACFPLSDMADELHLVDGLINEEVLIFQKDALIATFGEDLGNSDPQEVVLDRLGVTLVHKGNPAAMIAARNKLILTIVGMLILIALPIMAAAAILGKKAFIEPLQRFRSATAGITNGRAEVSLGIESSRIREIQLLASDFERMAIRVKEREASLQEAKDHLEERVAARTRELRDTDDRLHDILTGTNVGTWEWNVQTGETIFNERWAGIVGYTLEDLSPVSIDTWMSLVHPDDLKDSEKLLERHFAGETHFYNCECRMKHKDGQWVWVHDRGKVTKWTDDEKPLWIYGTHQEITARKLAESEMLRAVVLQRLVAEIAMHFVNFNPANTDAEIELSMGRIGKFMGLDRACVFMFSEQLRITSNTHEWCGFGVEPEIDKLQNLPTDMLPLWMERMKRFDTIDIDRVADLGPEASVERALLTAQGIQSVMVIPLAWRGRLEGFIGFDAVNELHAWTQTEQAALEFLGTILINAMKRRDMDQALRESHESLVTLNRTLEARVEERTGELKNTQSQLVMKEKLASVGQLAAGIAHELNNPIGFVWNNFTALKEDVEIFAELLVEYRALAGKVGQPQSPELTGEAARLAEKVENLKLDFILDDLQQLFTDSEDGFRRAVAIIESVRDFSRSEDAGAKVAYDLNEGIRGTLVISRNEYKYHADVDVEYGDIPSVRCGPNEINQVLLNIIMNAAQAIAEQERQEKGTIRILTYEEVDAVCCDISDDGPGIDEERQGRIFDPFYTTKEPGKGTGLGLSISYDIIVKKHNGDLLVTSEPGKGATFTIRLPKEGTT